jgi:hypothetical protein
VLARSFLELVVFIIFGRNIRFKVMECLLNPIIEDLNKLLDFFQFLRLKLIEFN